MKINKLEIIENICYTDLVYERINKKLVSNLGKHQIEQLIFKILKQTEEKKYIKKGKNFYITNLENNIKITVNSNTFRVITVDKITK